MKATCQLTPVGADVFEDRKHAIRSDPEYREIVAGFEIAESVARLVTAYRMEHSLSQRQLAERIGMSTPEISRLESGAHTPTGKTINRVLAAMNKHVEFVDNVSDSEGRVNPYQDDISIDVSSRDRKLVGV